MGTPFEDAFLKKGLVDQSQVDRVAREKAEEQFRSNPSWENFQAAYPEFVGKIARPSTVDITERGKEIELDPRDEKVWVMMTDRSIEMRSTPKTETVKQVVGQLLKENKRPKLVVVSLQVSGRTYWQVQEV